MNIDSNITQLLLIKSEIDDLKKSYIDTSNIDTSNILRLSNEYDIKFNTYTDYRERLELIVARLFPLQNYIFYALTDTIIHNEAFIVSMVENYSYFLKTKSKTTYITDLNPNYIRPISRIPSIILNFTNNLPFVVNLADYFLSVTQSTLHYTFTHRDFIPRDNLKLDGFSDNYCNVLYQPVYIYGKNITIIPDYRNDSYIIDVLAYDYYSSEVPLNIYINEVNFPIIQTNIQEYSIWLGRYNNNIITLYFTSNINNIDITYSRDIKRPILYKESPYIEGNNYYYISDYSNEYYIDRDSITINGDFIDICNVITNVDNVRIYPYPNEYPDRSELYPEFDTLLLKIYQAPYYFYKTYITPILENTEYIIDLKEFTDEYFFIDDKTTINILSSISYEEYPNRLNNDKGFATNIDDKIIIYPDFRNISYTLTIELQNPAYLSSSNILDIIVTESFPKVPIRTDRYLLLNKILFNTTNQNFELSRFFINPSHGDIAYTYIFQNLVSYSNVLLTYDTISSYSMTKSCNLYNENYFNLDNGYLEITPSFRYISYEIYIYASNVTYDAMDLTQFLYCTISENRPVIISTNYRIPNIVGFTDNCNYYNLAMYLYSPIGNILNYSVDYFTEKRIEYKTPAQIIDNNRLLLIADYRDTTYDIIITAIDPLYPVHPLSYKINIEELNAPYPKPKNKIFNITEPLNSIPYSLNLNILFTSIEWNIEYNLIEIDNSNYYDISTSNLIIYPDLRGEYFDIKVYAKNYEYESYDSNEYVTITYYENYPILKNPYNNVIENNVIIDLYDIFNSPIDNPLDFNIKLLRNNIIYKPRDSYINSFNAVELYDNLLYVYMDYRDVSYNVNIEAVDSNYANQRAFIDFIINEPKPNKVSASSYSLIYNKESFIINDLNVIDISANWNRNELLYYPNYIFEINNRLFISKSIYIEGCNLLITNITDLKFTVVPIEINIKHNNNIVSLQNYYVSFIDIPTIYVNNLTFNSYSYRFQYGFVTSNIIANPYNNVVVDSNIIYIKPNLRGNIGKPHTTISTNNTLLYGSSIKYDIKILYDNGIYLYFKIEELPPFFILPAYYDNNDMYIEFTTNIPYFFNPLDVFFNTKHTNLSIKFEEISNNNLRISNYPILQNRYSQAYTIDNKTGQINLYPDYRNKEYDILIKIFLDTFPDRYEIAKVHVKEIDINPITTTTNLIEFKNLLTERETIYLRRYYNTYVYNQYLTFEVSNVNVGYSSYFLSRNILYITPNAQGLSYDIRVIATDSRFNNINSNLIIHVQEDKFIYYRNEPFNKFNINEFINDELFSTPYELNVTPYFRTYNKELIEGEVTDCYIINKSDFSIVQPKTRPRDGIFNNRKQSQEGSYDYIATIKDSIMTFYVDSRFTTYLLEVSFWMKDHSNVDWNLTGNTFIVTESTKPVYIRNVFEGLNNIPTQFNMLSIYPTKSLYDSYTIAYNPNNNIEIIVNTLTLTPNCRGYVTTDSTVIKDNVIYYGKRESYEFITAYKDQIHIFIVTEDPPFYISLDFPRSYIEKTFTNNNPFTFTAITTYLLKNIAAPFIFEDNRDNLKIQGITRSKYPLDETSGILMNPFEINMNNGALTIYPEFRNTTYDIIVNVFTELYPNKSITFRYRIIENPIPTIISNPSLRLDKLLTNQIQINIREQYNYIFKKFLRFSISSDIEILNTHYFENDILYITPYARGLSYNITVTAKDNAFENINNNFKVSIIEDRYLRYNSNMYPSNVIVSANKLTNEPISFNFSSYFIKYYPNIPLKGFVSHAYIENNTSIIPRDGIYNSNYSNNDFEYLATIDDDVITIYPDYRGETYVIRTTIWLDGFIDPSWTLYNATFLITEDSKTFYIDDYFLDMNLISKDFDLSTVYPVPYKIDIDQYEISLNPVDSIGQNSNLIIVNPSCRGSVGSSTSERFINNEVYYGGMFEYNIEIKFVSNYSFNFSVTENPPFFVKKIFFNINVLNLSFNNLTPFTVQSLTPYFKTYTDLDFIVDYTLSRDVKPALYPIQDIYRPPFSINNEGMVIVYPFYRNITYSINLRVYLDTFPEKYVTATYNITESAIPPINNSINSITKDALYLDIVSIDLSLYYNTYVFAEFLNYSSLNLTNPYYESSNMYYIDKDILYLTPNRRELSYELQIVASDIKFNNKNTSLKIYVKELGYLTDRTDIIRNKPLNLLPLQKNVFTFNIASFFIKIFPYVKIQGKIINSYIVNDSFNPIEPRIRPRDGIFNIASYNGTFDYLGNIKDDIMYIYPDFRGIRYAVEFVLIIDDISYEDDNLKKVTFYISEDNQQNIGENTYGNIYDAFKNTLQEYVEPLFHEPI